MAGTMQLAPKRGPLMKKIILLVVVLALGGGGFWYYQSYVAKAAPPPATNVSYTVAKGNIFQAVASTGRVVANKDVEIKCKASGQVVTLPFDDVGMTVKKDALLVQVDPVDQKRGVRQAEVGLEQAQAKLAQAQQNLTVAEQALATSRQRNQTLLKSTESAAKEARAKARRRRELFEQNLTSPEELQTAETVATQAEAEFQNAKTAEAELKTQEVSLEVKRKDVALAQSAVKTAQIDLDVANQRLADTTVNSPIDGVVAVLNVQAGGMVGSGTTNVGGGTTIMILSDLSRIFINASVDESDIGKVRDGQDVQITLDSFAGKRFSGKVARVAPRGVNLSNVVTFEVKIEVTSKNKDLLKPEMTANVQIVSASKEDVLVVPVNAVTRKQGKYYANVEANGKTQERPVEIGLNDGERFEIVGGLKEGETVSYKKEEQQSQWRGGGGGMRPGGMPGFGGGGGRR
jgi:HlyD family secretion protein